MREMNELFEALARSSFRRRFRLGARERRYLEEKGMEAVLVHVREFLTERVAPARPRNDGKQTPMRGHPVFLAQHATGLCCRGCMEKWHGIEKGRELTEAEVEYGVRVIRRWLEGQGFEEEWRLL